MNVVKFILIYILFLLDVTPGEVGRLEAEGTARRSDRQGDGDKPRDSGTLPVLNNYILYMCIVQTDRQRVTSHVTVAHYQF